MIEYLLQYFQWNTEFITIQDLINNIVGLAVGIGAVMALFKLIFGLMRHMSNMR